MNNIVLVHGSFVDGSGWEPVLGLRCECPAPDCSDLGSDS
jgi:hypothetical protein